MATSQFKPDQKPRPLPAGVGPKALVRWGSLIKFLRATVEGFKLSTDGLDPMEFVGGLHLKNNGGAAGGSSDIWFPSIGSGEDGPYVTINPGTFNGVYPSIMVSGTPVSINQLPADRPKLFISGTGLEIGILKPAFTLTVSNGWVTLATLNGISIEIVTTEPDAVDLENTSGTYKFPLWAFMDGVLITPIAEKLSISGHVCAVETGDGTGALELTR